MKNQNSTRIALVLLAIIMFGTLAIFTVGVAQAQGPTPTKSVGAGSQDCFDLKSPSGPRTKPGGKDSAGNTCVAGLLWTSPEGKSLNVPYNGFTNSALTQNITATVTPTDTTSAPIQDTAGKRPTKTVCTVIEDDKTQKVEPGDTVVYHATNGNTVTVECVWDDNIGATQVRTEKTPLEAQFESWRNIVWSSVTILLSVVFGLAVIVMAILVGIGMVHGDLFHSIQEAFEHWPNWMMGPTILGVVASSVIYWLKAPLYVHIGVWIVALIMMAFAKQAEGHGGEHGGEHAAAPHAEEEHN